MPSYYVIYNTSFRRNCKLGCTGQMRINRFEASNVIHRQGTGLFYSSRWGMSRAKRKLNVSSFGGMKGNSIVPDLPTDYS